MLYCGFVEWLRQHGGPIAWCLLLVAGLVLLSTIGLSLSQPTRLLFLEALGSMGTLGLVIAAVFGLGTWKRREKYKLVSDLLRASLDLLDALMSVFGVGKSSASIVATLVERNDFPEGVKKHFPNCQAESLVTTIDKLNEAKMRWNALAAEGIAALEEKTVVQLGNFGEYVNEVLQTTTRLTEMLAFLTVGSSPNQAATMAAVRRIEEKLSSLSGEIADKREALWDALRSHLRL